MTTSWAARMQAQQTETALQMAIDQRNELFRALERICDSQYHDSPVVELHSAIDDARALLSTYQKV